MFNFTRLNLARQFLLVSFLVLLTGMLIIGAWVGRQIEAGVLNRTAAVTALYVDSFIAPHLQDLARARRLGPASVAALDTLLSDTPLGQRIVAFKVWAPDGTILYSTNPALTGRRFPVTPALARAFAGDVQAEISDLTDPENEFERQYWPRLIETYAPVHAEGGGGILAVSEFYQTTNELQREVRAAQWRSWLVVGVATLAMYALLAGLVGRASNIILAQQGELRDKVAQLTALLAQNESLHQRVRRAAARTTALNERFLRRIAADLHDGPGQDLGLALLRIEALAELCAGCALPAAQGSTAAEDFRTVQTALQSALADLRTLAAGLRLPELDSLAPAEVAQRAVSDYQRKTGQAIGLALDAVPEAAPLPVKITLYRLLQESLANGYRHGRGIGQRVRIGGEPGVLVVEIADAGPGFDPKSAISNGRLGLAGMRERVEILGGAFQVDSAPARGTTVRARLPLSVAELEDERAD